MDYTVLRTHIPWILHFSGHMSSGFYSSKDKHPPDSTLLTLQMPWILQFSEPTSPGYFSSQKMHPGIIQFPEHASRIFYSSHATNALDTTVLRTNIPWILQFSENTPLYSTYIPCNLQFSKNKFPEHYSSQNT